MRAMQPARIGSMKVLLATALALIIACSAIGFFQNAEEETAWVCPMHPDYTMDIAGNCPRC